MKTKKRQKLEVTVVAKATFGVNEIADLDAWKDSIISYGEIIKEKIKVISEDQ